ncbi:uncharacterized protein MAM_05173 [Metarhizium album ARSEF 1941]|uniref:Uncharacterized protein n=1 Tax=Metarhizium album (strain ARSEF 1941) TaxID=1081103 RepID=A0A0B2WTT0_METAS|nr:uncharacterized protein MAM_05173 [Metarhizium album ARSEF 1941]KHN97064.1 hypothetical protein MAM_05173 [Metarhizium album ARSEF 1941]
MRLLQRLMVILAAGTGALCDPSTSVMGVAYRHGGLCSGSAQPRGAQAIIISEKCFNTSNVECVVPSFPRSLAPSFPRSLVPRPPVERQRPARETSADERRALYLGSAAGSCWGYRMHDCGGYKRPINITKGCNSLVRLRNVPMSAMCRLPVV